jgi:hypothetical protein
MKHPPHLMRLHQMYEVKLSRCSYAVELQCKPLKLQWRAVLALHRNAELPPLPLLWSPWWCCCVLMGSTVV